MAVFPERKLFAGKIHEAYFDARRQYSEWWKLHDDELQILFQRPDTVKGIKKKKKIGFRGGTCLEETQK